MSPVDTDVNDSSNSKHSRFANMRKACAPSIAPRTPEECENQVIRQILSTPLDSNKHVIQASLEAEQEEKASGYGLQASGKLETCCLMP